MGAAPVGVAQQQWEPPPDPGTTKRSAFPWIIAAVIAVLAAVGAYFLVGSLIGGSDISGTVDECSIAPDGALVASGTLSSDDALDATLEVRFDDSDTGTEVDRDTVDVSGAGGETIEWSAQGQAGDEVGRVTCVLGSLD